VGADVQLLRVAVYSIGDAAEVAKVWGMMKSSRVAFEEEVAMQNIHQKSRTSLGKTSGSGTLEL